MERFLYRGVNPDLFHSTCRGLMPRACGNKFKRHVHFGEDVFYGDGSVYGESERNAVIMHQRDSSRFPTSGISTTPIFESAVRYATHAGKYRSGYIYKIDVMLLQAHGVTAYPVDQHAVHPAIPEDHEVILEAVSKGVVWLESV